MPHFRPWKAKREKEKKSGSTKWLDCLTFAQTTYESTFSRSEMMWPHLFLWPLSRSPPLSVHFLEFPKPFPATGPLHILFSLPGRLFCLYLAKSPSGIPLKVLSFKWPSLTPGAKVGFPLFILYTKPSSFSLQHWPSVVYVLTEKRQ